MAKLLRIELIVLAIIIAFCSIYSVNRKKLNVRYSLPWIVIAVGVLVAAIWPRLVERICELTKIETPVNLVFLLGICVLLMLTFQHEKVISKQADQIRRLTQMVSIREYENELKMKESSSDEFSSVVK